MGLTPSVFWDMTQREFWNALEGFYENEEQRDRREWIRTRWQTCLFLNCYTSKDTMLQPKDLIRFDWEDEEVREVHTPTTDDFERIKKKYNLK